MSIKGIGVREAVALAALALALVFGFLFFDPASTDGPGERRTPATTTRETAAGLSPWSVTWLEGADLDSAVVSAQGELPELDLSYEAGPFPDVADDRWALTATARFEGAPGRYFFELTYTGTIGLAVNGEDRKISPETGSGTITIPFDQPETGATTFTLRLRDTSGPAAIRARVAQ